MIDVSNYIFFWMTGEYNEQFSNWYPCEFVIDGVTYQNTEQYFMAQKALTFDNPDLYEEILKTADPERCKKLGRKVCNFDGAVWDAKKRDVMYEACYAKFSQNPKLRAKLLKTGEINLVEASPYDKIWGIGLGAQQAMNTDPAFWPGQNLQGKCLMRVREQLRLEEQRQDLREVRGVKLAFFDVDGVLSAPIYKLDGQMRSGLGTVEEWMEYCTLRGEDAYDQCRPVPVVRAYARMLKENGATLYALTTSFSSMETGAKRKFVEKYYPDLFADVLAVSEDSYKVPTMLTMAKRCEVPASDCQIIDDTLSILFAAEAKNIQGRHVSQLFAEVE